MDVSIRGAGTVNVPTNTKKGKNRHNAQPWEQSLLAIAVSQSAITLTDLPLSRASFAPTGFAPFDP
ncbi:hypothetical protein FGE05_26165 [Pseudomonas sp. ICMP22404]|nr:hypothetical protein FGE05_26165 [Pseudomonas sp. ICMP22404]